MLSLLRRSALLLLLDRHCRSHNIAAECCVGSRREEGARSEDEGAIVMALPSRLEVIGDMVEGKRGGSAIGSCLMLTSVDMSKRVSRRGEAGLVTSTELRESMREGTGVVALSRDVNIYRNTAQT